MSPDVVIVDALRTPVGRLLGGLKSIRADDLAAHVIRAIVERNAVPANAIDDVIFGCANQAGEDNRNVARMALLLAGLPQTVPGATVNRLCASGLEAVNLCARTIRAGEADVLIAGGVENMSRAPWVMAKPIDGKPVGNRTAYDTSLGWRFPNPKMEAMFPLEAMGCTAENLVDRHGFTREAQDAFALSSQHKAAAAWEAGRMADEVVPVPVPQRKGEPIAFTHDESIRADSSLEALGRLRPVFRSEGGSVTAGNSSPLNDGAAAILLTTREFAAERGWTPLAVWRASAAAGVDPTVMGIGPVPATKKALDRAGWDLDSVDLIELNEAFAAQSLAVMAELNIDPERVNVNGGAIAIGHPLGCSGARILTTLLHEMKRSGAKRGLATLCVGVGQGVATLVERD
jgi:3-oxoadipyl-CoA thiolase